MKTFIASFDNLVTDDGPIIIPIKAFDIGQANDIAYEMSKRTGFSEGNFELYISENDLNSLREAEDAILTAVEMA